MIERATDAAPSRPPGRRYVPAVGQRLRRLLAVVFALFALLAVNSVYLVVIRLAGAATGAVYENYFFLWMFLLHVVLGLVVVVPVVVFGIAHIRNTRNRPNRRAVRAGYALFAVSLVLLATGFVLLTRADGAFAARAPLARESAYWIHALAPLVVVWLFVLHRLAGRRIKWKVGLAWTAVAAAFAAIMLVLQAQDPRAWNVAGNPRGEEYFAPALSRTVDGEFIPERVIANDEYCRECHPDVHDTWSNSVHKFSSFNNPIYEFSIRETRRKLFDRDGSVHGSRFCAGCHDPVPLFTGEFDHPRYTDPEYDLSSDRLANAGVTCTSCHAITHVNSVRGNGDYTIEEPIHYPFTFSDNAFLRWVNRQLVKAKPEFHRKTFLKPLHKTTEFCGTCHKVHLPVELNDYRWLRGQNHYDSFRQSGVSGHGIASYYYPAQAEVNCNDCHMPLVASDEFGAQAFETDPAAPLFGQPAVHDHQFPSANTGVAHLLGLPDEVIEKHRAFLQGIMRVDVFGVREGGTINGRQHAPLGAETAPTLEPGATYLFETVIRAVQMGHLFTEGTSDSNQVWLDVTVTDGERVIGRSGGMGPDGEVDPWSHFGNAFVLDRDGNRIARRNPEDIFVSLYNHQVPPGAADVVFYRLALPDDVAGPVTIEVKLRYRKFDTALMRLIQGETFEDNDLPIVTLATDRFTFDVASAAGTSAPRASDIPAWQRWNDYGIGLLRRQMYSQALAAFAEVEALGRPEGPLNLARVHIAEGSVQEAAPAALARAAAFDPPAYPWSVLWFGSDVDMINGRYDDAIVKLERIVASAFPLAIERSFDFSRDERVLNRLGEAFYQRALGESDPQRQASLEAAREQFRLALVQDPEDVPAYWGLKLVSRELGDAEAEAQYAELHARYKVDDNARDRAFARARAQYPAADRAAERVVIYDLDRPGAFELPAAPPKETASR